MLKIHFILILILSFSQIFAQSHWESIVSETDEFKYTIPTKEPVEDWRVLDFSDDNWQTGNGGFGYGDNDDTTVIPVSKSIFLRKEFSLTSADIVNNLILDIDYDDAFVAYLNGVEIGRSGNLSAGTPTINASVSSDHEARLYSGGQPERFSVNKELVQTGTNVLAVHILNISLNSSDMSSRIFLNAEFDGSNILFSDVPDWFQEPVSYTYSNLPIIKINTEGKFIKDEPKIMAKMQIINNANGVNYFDDTTFEYDGDIGIEIRGNTAQMFPKKSYTVETRLSDGSNNNVSILGMPKENDWVLHGPYSDKSLMRNALAYNIGHGMKNGWHPRNRFVELEINGEYRGVYLFVEKIKIDNNRVDIATLKPDDNSGDELTGGYIISIDRDQEGSWNSPYMGRTGSVDVPFSYVDPKYDELTPEQRAYIREYITEFEDALHGDNFKDPEQGYRAYIDVESFVDYFIITELSRDLDGYRVSVYFHKDKDSKGGKIVMTPFWDYNICFGNANFFSAGYQIGWASDGIGAGDWYEIPFWWDRFREDPYFETVLKYRWEELRKDVLNKNNIFGFIDSCSYELKDAQVRNFEKFNILDSYVWPNNYVGGTYPNEIQYLKTWINGRIDWLDEQMDKIEPVTSIDQDLTASNEMNPLVYPNPFSNRFTVEIDANSYTNMEVVIENLLGQTVCRKSLNAVPGRQRIEITYDELGQHGNMFIYSIYSGGQRIKSGTIMHK
ncbi:CotH kinase family protein [Maribellus mangrovi]|uniref:CotH kinase family protein n=1 Tax=Maribellus mangrovi TaxID=3133146 RepID=UPI0030ED8CC5